MSHQRAHRDGNHADIVNALKAAGRSVLDLSGNGKGCPDILVAWGRAHMVLLEIKNPSGKNRVQANQLAWHQAWRGPAVVVVRSVEEALAACGVPS